MRLRLIIGGYAQGKTEYAMEWAGKNPPMEGERWEIWKEFHLWIREELRQGKSSEQIEEEIAKRLACGKPIIIISDEVGNGVVPLDAFERDYREQVGRQLILLAKKAESVERVICKIPMKIK